MLPKEPNMLLSYINTKLRDDYDSLSELAGSLGVDTKQICKTLATIGYKYDESNNRFIR